MGISSAGWEPPGREEKYISFCDSDGIDYILFDGHVSEDRRKASFLYKGKNECQAAVGWWGGVSVFKPQMRADN